MMDLEEPLTARSSNSLSFAPLYCHSLDAVVHSDWFPYIDPAWTHITENISCDRYAASSLVRWLLPSNSLGMDLQKTHHVTSTHCCYVTSLQTKKTLHQYCWPPVCCGRCIAMDLYITIYSLFSLMRFIFRS